MQSMFIVAPFTVAKTWKQPRCPLIANWIKRIWHIYTWEYYSFIRKDEMLPFLTTLIDLENILLSEISHSKKAKNYDFTHMWEIEGGTQKTQNLFIYK